MKSVVLVSGGLDSTVLLHHLVARGDEVLGISVDYGQRHLREIECARWQCASLKVSHESVDLSCLKFLLKRFSHLFYDIIDQVLRFIQKE